MRYILTAISLLAFCTMANAAEPTSKDKIMDLQGQVKQARAEIKSLRASERIDKAVDKFCTANAENAHYMICQQGPWVEADTVKGKVSKR